MPPSVEGGHRKGSGEATIGLAVRFTRRGVSVLVDLFRRELLQQVFARAAARALAHEGDHVSLDVADVHSGGIRSLGLHLCVPVSRLVSTRQGVHYVPPHCQAEWCNLYHYAALTDFGGAIYVNLFNVIRCILKVIFPVLSRYLWVIWCGALGMEGSALRCLFGFAVVFALMASAAAGQPQYKLDKSGKRVVRISGLAPDGMCLPDKIVGTVVERGFGASGTVLESFTLEVSSGERVLVNVDLSGLDAASMIDQRWIHQALQILTKKGRKVAAGLVACGAAGRVLYLDSLK